MIFRKEVNECGTTEPLHNDPSRAERGNNRYSVSNIDQWLNKDNAAGTWYVDAHDLDQSPNNDSYVSHGTKYAARPGFLYYFTENEKAAILLTTIRVASSIPESGSIGSYEDINRKIYLPSQSELWKGNENGIAEGTPWRYYLDSNPCAAKLTSGCYENTLSTTKPAVVSNNWNWWLRTPYYSTAYASRYINTSGSISAGANDNSGYIGVRPAVNLSSSLLVSSTTDPDGCYTVEWDAQPSTAPSTPPSITVPSSIMGGTTIDISWEASTDPDGNLAGYELERSVGGGDFTQIYKGANLSYTDSITYGWSTVQYRVRAYDPYSTSGYRTSDVRNVVSNTAPTVPSNISVPTEIFGGSSIVITWAASSDIDNNLAGYKLEKSTDSGATWTQIYQGAETTYSDSVVMGTPSVTYRVKAYDNLNAESAYKTSTRVTVINNQPPTVPKTISVPVDVYGGGTLVVSWGQSTDPDGNLSGYELERSVNSGAFEQVYKGENLSYTDSITFGWNTVQYRVRAYDPYIVSDYKTSAKRTVTNNSAPVISCSYASGTNLGTKSAGFSISYSVNDADAADNVTVTEKLDNQVKRTFTATKGANNSFAVTGEYFQKILNGNHTLTIQASDGKVTTTHTLTFTKQVTKAVITFTTPMEGDGSPITVCIVSVVGSFPADGEFKVEVTNNAKDASPVWEDCTSAVIQDLTYHFLNQTAVNGYAFNFRVTAERGASGIGGYINSIEGGFQ